MYRPQPLEDGEEGLIELLRQRFRPGRRVTVHRLIYGAENIYPYELDVMLEVGMVTGALICRVGGNALD